MEAEGELEAVGVLRAQGDGVGGDAGVGVVLAGDGVAGDVLVWRVCVAPTRPRRPAERLSHAIVRGPGAEGVPAGPAIAGEGDAGEGLDPGAGGGDGVPGGDELAEGLGRVVDRAGRFAGRGVRGEGEGAVVEEVEPGALPGLEGAGGGAEGGELGGARLAQLLSLSPCSVGSSTIL